MTLRLLELTQRYPPAIGGVEQHVERLVRHARASGFQVEVSTTDLDRDHPLRRLPSGAPALPGVRRHTAVEAFPAPNALGVAAPGMLADALRTRADVIHAHAFAHFPTWAGAMARRLRGTPLVVTPHFDAGSGSEATRLFSAFVARSTLAPAARVVSQSPTESRLLAAAGVDPGRIVEIPTPIDLAEFPGPLEPRPDRTRPVVLFVGRLNVAQKGLDLLLEAVAGLPEPARPDLRIVGEDWGDGAALRALAHRLGVSETVHLTGALARSQVIQEYARADLFVLPSRFDSAPVVVREAMAMGLAVVATRVGGVPEMLRDGEEGLLVPPGAPKPLAAAIRELLEDPTRRSRLGGNGALTSRRCSWEELGPRYVAMFQEVATER